MEQNNQWQDKQDIKSLELAELTEAMVQMGQPKFRGKQVYSWLHEKRVESFEEMSNLPAAFRQQLAQNYYINSLSIIRKLTSKIDGTQKYLLRLKDNNCVEAVLMKYKYGNSVCISTQVGCRMGCKFCASTLAGLVRSLEPSEMLDEIYTVTRDSGQRVSNVVLMGIGEPFDNYDNVMKFLHILSSPEGYNLSLRHLSLSTCGLVDRIYQLAEEKVGLTLSISLHAPNDEIRSQTMPINKRYPIDELLEACRYYFNKTGRRISFEYALIEGVNDEVRHANELADRLRGMSAHVNLIPVNPVKERGFKRGSRQRIEAFQKALEARGVNATIRRELGADINAACGQLRREYDQQRSQGREEL
ncbi:23S rRNA (adenine(2503)-C(2))-methyltransferase RlmN [uncultured Negativibacillus sp.]|uniref:23S rRNA (adenine(2503)-C(2))-methyltransferase RlmN n=1 Tax=uncultured Negativibacillus sp. TaxID=1980696 RepID=UPI0025E7D866|nr:23S rRNA (adenine(2503)-C(2))-methyltransferase RlmN [uncultured Negativibacillus sp.]